MNDDRTVNINPDDDPRTIALGSPDAVPGTGPTNDIIGPYHLVRKIGEGGMGIVYEANQFEPIRRRVALKMVKRGMATEEFIARFDSERQALAVMDHPSIARVLDAGATAEGQPFFVMEYVEGVPLNTYCDDEKLSIKDRLLLFIKICDGVQHAHQKAVIHRDLKPGNVMVTTVDGQPVPKIIDFGVAKVLDDNQEKSTHTTGVGQLVGTPEYMSPEQATFDATAVDTTTDVYSLGVVLYELMVGELPFTPAELKDKGFQEILRIIREEDPPKPTSRLLANKKSPQSTIHTIAQHRDTGPDALYRNLVCDLDWITMKALEKDKDRRYETANALAMDIRRHLDYEPVRACPPSRTYRIRKFARRNRTWVGAASFVLAAIVLGIVGTTVGMVRAVRAEKQAQLEAQTSQQVSDFLVGLFQVADPDQARGNTITAREILDNGSQHIETELASQPLTQARLMHTIGKVYRNLGLYNEASPKLESALAYLRATPDKNEEFLITSLVDLAELYIDQAKYQEAEKILQQALILTDKTDTNNSLQLAVGLSELAGVYRRQGKYAEAEPLYERARDIRISALGPNDTEVARSHNSLAILNYQRGHFDEAEAQYFKALEIWREVHGTNHADIAKGLNNLALLYHHQNQFEKAEPIYQEATAIYEKILGPDHPRLAMAFNNLALVYYETEQYEKAEPLYLKALSIREKTLGTEHPDVAQTINNLANLSRKQNQFAEAAPLYQRALTIRRTALGPDHPMVAWTLRDLACLDHELGHSDEALQNFDSAVRIFSKAHGPEHPDLVEILADYARVMRASNQSSRADSLDQMAQAIIAKEKEK